MKKRHVLLFLMVFILTGCGGSPNQSNVTTEEPSSESSTEPTMAPTTESTTQVSFEKAYEITEIALADDGMKDPYGVAINSQGHIYVSDMGNDRVLIFDAAGKRIGTWDKKGSGEGEFNSMGFGGIAIDSKDNVFVVDNENHRIQKFDRDGNFVAQWGTEGNPSQFDTNNTENGQFIRAIGIAIDAEDHVYVTDDGYPYVQKFDNDGVFLMRFGGPGEGEGTFKHATGIAVDGKGNSYVSDYETKWVQKFDAKGQYVLSWKLGEDIGIEGTPEGIAVDEEGHVYVTDYDLGRIQVFDENGAFLWSIGGKVSISNPFRRPTGIAINATGRLIVINQSTGQISIVEIKE